MGRGVRALQEKGTDALFFASDVVDKCFVSPQTSLDLLVVPVVKCEDVS